MKPEWQRHVGWRRSLASFVAVALAGVALCACTVDDLLPTCADAVVITFPGLDLTTKPSASVWVDGFRACKNAVPLDEAEYKKTFSPGGVCGLRRSGELFVILYEDEPHTVMVRLNYDQTPGPTRSFEVDFDDVEPNAEGCRRLDLSF